MTEGLPNQNRQRDEECTTGDRIVAIAWFCLWALTFALLVASWLGPEPESYNELGWPIDSETSWLLKKARPFLTLVSICILAIWLSKAVRIIRRTRRGERH